MTSFKYLGATLCFVCFWIRLNRIWRCNTMSFASKFKFYKSLVTSILFHGCVTRTLLADPEKGSSLSKPSAWGNLSASPSRSTRPTIGCRASSPSLWVTRHHSLSKTIRQGTSEGGRYRGRQRKCWMDNIKEWTTLPMPELFTRASCRKDWKRILAESSQMSFRRPKRSRNWIELTELLIPILFCYDMIFL